MQQEEVGEEAALAQWGASMASALHCPAQTVEVECKELGCAASRTRRRQSKLMRQHLATLQPHSGSHRA